MAVHVFPQSGNQLDAIGKQAVKQSLVEIIGVALGQIKQQFSSFIDSQMDFKPIEPSHGGFPAFGQPGEDLVVVNPPVMADPKPAGVDKADAVATAHAAMGQNNIKTTMAFY